MQKRLELFLTALLPIVVLVVGFFAVSSKAGLDTDVSPEGARPFYGPGFGKEVTSDQLCPPSDPDEGFDIYQTSETATVSDTRHRDLIRWHRSQRWDFMSDNTPWGTNNVETTTSGLINIHYKENGNYLVPRGSTGTGFPWSGYEVHTRGPTNTDVDYILVYAYVTGWRYYKHTANGKEYICPNYYKTHGNYKFYCNTRSYVPGSGFKEVYNQRRNDKDYYFSEPMFRDEEQLILSREEIKIVDREQVHEDKHTGNWHSCIEVND